MDTHFLSQLRNNRRDAAPHNLLGIRLSRVDHIVDNCATAKIWPRHFGLSVRINSGRGHPGSMTVRVGSKRFVIEIKSQMTEFPELISDVFAGVGYGAVRANNDLVGLVFVGSSVRLERHHLATFGAALVREVDRAPVLHQLKRAFPKMKMQNLRLARELIVANAQTLPRIEDAFNIAGGDIVSQLGRRIIPRFNRVKNIRAEFKLLRILFGLDVSIAIEQSNTRVQIPTVIVE